MVGFDCFPMMKKRKEIDSVNDEVYDFSLSSPARKIRRLDLNLPPIMEEDEIQTASPVDEEKAIVLFKPLQPSSSGHLFVDEALMLGLKKKFRQEAEVVDDLYEADEKTKKQHAVVPWNPTQFHFHRSTESYKDPPPPEIVELDGEDVMMEEADMDVDEEENSCSNNTNVSFPQWQQQQQQQQFHCMIPQIPQTNATPIIWYP